MFFSRSEHRPEPPKQRKRVLVVSLLCLALFFAVGMAGVYGLLPDLKSHAGMLANSVSGDAATSKQACHNAVNSSLEYPTMPTTGLQTLDNWTETFTNEGNLFVGLYYCAQENSVIGAYSYVANPGQPTARNGACYLLASYSLADQKPPHDLTAYNPDPGHDTVLGTCSGSYGNPDVATPAGVDLSAAPQQTRLAETYPGDSWQACWIDTAQPALNSAFSVSGGLSNDTVDFALSNADAYCSSSVSITSTTVSGG